MEELSHKEVFEYFEKHSVDGKISMAAIEQLVFDSRFPTEVFEKGKNFLINDRENEKRLKIVVSEIQPLLDKYRETFNTIQNLKKNYIANKILIREYQMELSALKVKLAPLEIEMDELIAYQKDKLGLDNGNIPES